MKLVAPGVGWARTNHGLLWTENGGADWRDITPPSSFDLDENLSDIFFLDAHSGWALFSRFDKDESEKDKYEPPEFDVASTTDSGETWTRTHLTFPKAADYGNPHRMPLSGWAGKIAFRDPLHGWMNVTLAGQTMNTFWAFLMVTSDGGRTWSRAPSDPGLGDADMLWVTPSDWWIVGRSEFSDTELYVTHDGAKSWKQVSVDIPKEVLPARLASYYFLPTFQDKEHGFLEVSYSGGVGEKSAAVLFATADGGRTWKPDRIVTQAYDSEGSGTPIVVGSAWIWVAVLNRHPMLKTVGAGERIDFSADATTRHSSYHAALDASFVTPTQGWIIVGDGDLVSTTDGGATWTDITPGPKRPQDSSPTN